MNTIIQKRIEEAAKEEKIDFLNRFNWSGNQETGFKKGAVWMLDNQWISVEEALPDKRHEVLVAILNTKTNTHFFGLDAIVDDSVFLRDKNGFTIDVDYHKITHWMPIPSLEGGEK